MGPRARVDDLKKRISFVPADILTANFPTRILCTILTAIASAPNSSGKCLVCVSLFEILSWNVSCRTNLLCDSIYYVTQFIMWLNGYVFRFVLKRSLVRVWFLTSFVPCERYSDVLHFLEECALIISRGNSQCLASTFLLMNLLQSFYERKLWKFGCVKAENVFRRMA